MLAASRRLSALARHALPHGARHAARPPRGMPAPRLRLRRGLCSAAAAGDGAPDAPDRDTVSIGGVTVVVRDTPRKELVPVGYGSTHDDAPLGDLGAGLGITGTSAGAGSRDSEVSLSQEELGHLRWMMSKDSLAQDMFLVGSPGPHRRRLVMLYAQLTGREVEVLAVSRDTTESDLKQRREIVGGSAVFVDQSPVRAAVHGRILVLDGLEKAERNVLPTLNNLLENREMGLEDGRFLVHPDRYDALLAEGVPQAELDARKLVRVHADFRVVALGLPVPPYPGKPLDPPLRSRFQARRIPPPTASEMVSAVSAAAPGLSSGTISDLVGFAQTLHIVEAQSESFGSRVPHFPASALPAVARTLQAFPKHPAKDVLTRAFPYPLFDESAQMAVGSGRGGGGAAAASGDPSGHGDGGSGGGGGGHGEESAYAETVRLALEKFGLSAEASGTGAGDAASGGGGQYVVGSIDIKGASGGVGASSSAARTAANGAVAASAASEAEAEAVAAAEARHSHAVIAFHHTSDGAAGAAAGAGAGAGGSSGGAGGSVVVSAPSAGVSPGAVAALMGATATPAAGSTAASAPSSSVPAAVDATAPRSTTAHTHVVETPSIHALLVGMLQDHAAGRDVCILGDKGTGKSAVARLFASRLGYPTELFALFSDMSARDLVQRRTTDPSGNTIWQPSPLVTAALRGHMLLLDGVHRIPGETLGVLQRLALERSMDLFDGSRLVSWERYQELRARYPERVPPAHEAVAAALRGYEDGYGPAGPVHGSDGSVQGVHGGGETARSEGGAAPVVTAVTAPDDAGVRLLPVHPSFRIVAMAPPPGPGASVSGGGEGQAAGHWLHPEVVPMFGFHSVPSLDAHQLAAVLGELFPAAPRAGVRAVTSLRAELKRQVETEAVEDPATAAALVMSTRQLIRLTRRLAATHERDHAGGGGAGGLSAAALQERAPSAAAWLELRSAVHEALLLPFLPPGTAAIVNAAMDVVGMAAPGDAGAAPSAATAATATAAPASAPAAAGTPRQRGAADHNPTITQHDDPPAPTAPAYASLHAHHLPANATSGTLTIGDVSYPMGAPAHPELVPRPLFYDIPRHKALMRALLSDVAAGERHLLLIGNQGVGKNKLADRLLQLMRVEREYIQLHRDSTVQSLTLAPSLVDGVIVWEDSPLVRAARMGRTLVVDEADKAPLEVVCVLKGLLEDGEMRLADGRRLLSPELAAMEAAQRGAGAVVGDAAAGGDGADASAAAGAGGAAAGAKESVIPIHPDFRMWVLANRPGFPFLGNNLFAECGDVLSSHVVDNPDVASERALLLSYAPGTDPDVLTALTGAFAELRALNEKGLLAYPYSTRELVAVVRHMAAYPDDGVVATLENVFAFDSFDARLRGTIAECFNKHGIPLPAEPGDAPTPVVRLAESRRLPRTTQTEAWSLVAARGGGDGDGDGDGDGGGGDRGGGSGGASGGGSAAGSSGGGGGGRTPSRAAGASAAPTAATAGTAAPPPHFQVLRAALPRGQAAARAQLQPPAAWPRAHVRGLAMSATARTTSTSTLPPPPAPASPHRGAAAPALSAPVRVSPPAAMGWTRWRVPEQTVSAFAVTDTRLSVFSEEKARWTVLDSSEAEARVRSGYAPLRTLSMCRLPSDDSIHVLAQNPFALHSYRGVASAPPTSLADIAREADAVEAGVDGGMPAFDVGAASDGAASASASASGAGAGAGAGGAAAGAGAEEPALPEGPAFAPQRREHTSIDLRRALFPARLGGITEAGGGSGVWGGGAAEDDDMQCVACDATGEVVVSIPQLEALLCLQPFQTEGRAHGTRPGSVAGGDARALSLPEIPLAAGAMDSASAASSTRGGAGRNGGGGGGGSSSVADALKSSLPSWLGGGSTGSSAAGGGSGAGQAVPAPPLGGEATRSSERAWLRLDGTLGGQGFIVAWRRGGAELRVLDLAAGDSAPAAQCYTVALPAATGGSGGRVGLVGGSWDVEVVSPAVWAVRDARGEPFWLRWGEDAPWAWAERSDARVAGGGSVGGVAARLYPVARSSDGGAAARTGGGGGAFAASHYARHAGQSAPPPLPHLRHDPTARAYVAADAHVHVTLGVPSKPLPSATALASAASAAGAGAEAEDWTAGRTGEVAVFSSVRGGPVDGDADVASGGGGTTSAAGGARAGAGAEGSFVTTPPRVDGLVEVSRRVLGAAHLTRTAQIVAAHRVTLSPDEAGTTAATSPSTPAGLTRTGTEVELEVVDTAHDSYRRVLVRGAGDRFGAMPEELSAASGAGGGRFSGGVSGLQDEYADGMPSSYYYQGGGSGSAAQAARSREAAASAALRAELSAVVGVEELSSGEVVTLQGDGRVRVWELGREALDRSLGTWRKIMGVRRESDPLSLSLNAQGRAEGKESLSPPDLTEPKHGKEDPNNEAHSGGGTWAGGTGGSNTAGLGGRGGPYRLDKGHTVNQVSDELKAQVSEEAQAKARDMAQRGLEERLREINMTQQNHDMYESMLGRLGREIAQMRVVLQAAEARTKERQWVRHQTSGELDDTKLVDGVTGERLIYKRRADLAPQPGSPPPVKKKLVFLLDVSASMYRFNGTDARLTRLLETTLMILEALKGFEHKFDFAMRGHSGDSDAIPFVNWGAPPRDRAERLKLLNTMVAHSQYCFSGDNTVEATERAVNELAALPEGTADERIVFVISDCNMRRYGIPPSALAKRMTAHRGVKCFAVFIASLGDESARTISQLPAGRAFACFDTADLPRLMRTMLTSQLTGGL